MYKYDLDEKLADQLKKLAKKDKNLYAAVEKKVLQIAENPHIAKPLGNVLKGKRRVHIGHFVLIYEIDENVHKVTFLKFTHHDEAYK